MKSSRGTIPAAVRAISGFHPEIVPRTGPPNKPFRPRCAEIEVLVTTRPGYLASQEAKATETGTASIGETAAYGAPRSTVSAGNRRAV